ncbi:MAG: Maltose transport system permease protein MalF [Actinomycetota bacterium]|jgi:arabinogalactan oligomer/maltooligosaccharide transport system permease protein
MSDLTAKNAKKALRLRNKQIKKLYDGGVPSLRGTIFKIVLLGLLDAGALFVISLLFLKQQWIGVGLLAVVTLVVNWLYLRRGGLPAKYLTPGVLFLLVFQVYIVFYSGFIAFTNYGSLHNGSMASAVDAIKQSAVVPVEGAPAYDIKIVKSSDGEINFLATDFDSLKTYIGGTDYKDHPFREVTAADGVTLGEDGLAASIDGYKQLTDAELTAAAGSISNIKVPLTADIEADGFLQTPDGLTAEVAKFDAVYDEKAETFTRLSDGVVFNADQSQGFFVAKETGERLDIGWQVVVGWANFDRIFGDQELRGPLLGILAWTFTFAIGSVLSTFVVGLALALLLNDDRIRGKKIYRAIMILPYAFPAFLSAYVWKGMFNTENGLINTTILNLGPDNLIPWLTEVGPARWAVLLVNLWLGFPYMFLISTGALQSIPSELTESATLDGATPWQEFRLIKLPLLLVSLAPLLISSFAYNFNNFTIIYLLTGGGPGGDPTLKLDAGGTDILITFVYKIAFSGSVGADYGLASAFSILIFLIVGSISYATFRRTRALEDMD